MKLLNVNLQGFGQFNNGLNVDFSPDGLTVVYGRNEAGKSTLLSAIVGVLFGFRDLNLVRKYEPWDEYEAYGGEVSLTADDGRVLKISRDFKTHHATITEIKDGAELDLFTGSADPRGNKEEDHNYFHILGDILGFQDESVFRNTVFFGQQCLQTAVSDQIRRLLTGSTDVDYKGALHELHSRFAELTTENPWRSRGKARKRLIEETRTQLEQERTQLEDGRESLFRSLELEEELERLQRDLADLEEKRSSVAEKLKLHTALGELLTRRETARKGYEESLARRDNFRRYADRAKEIRGILDKTYSHFKNAPDDLPEMVRTFASEEEAMTNESLQLEQEGKRLAELRPDPNTGLGWFLFVLVAGIGVAVGSLTAIGLPAGAIGGVALGAAAFAIGRNIGTGYAQAKAAIEHRITVLQTTIKKRSAQCEDIRHRTGSLLVGRETEDILREHSRYKEFQEESMRLSAALSALGSQEDVNRKFEEAAREQGMVDANLARIMEEEPDLVGMDDRQSVIAAVKALKEIAESLEEQTAATRRRIEEYRVELAGLSARMDFDLAVLEEGIREKERSLKRYDLERSALKESIDTLDECVKDFQEGDVFRLGEEITNLFSRITDEKYTRVHLGSSMDPVISRGDHVPISPADLSQGARDQLYFAMRIAMARHLSRNINLPLFLDDPFVNFDNERLHVTKEVIDHLKGHQVVLVTCGREYRNWGRKLVDLDELKASAA